MTDDTPPIFKLPFVLEPSITIFCPARLMDLCVDEICKSSVLATNSNAVDVISISSDLIVKVPLEVNLRKFVPPLVASPTRKFPPPSMKIPSPASTLVAEPNSILLFAAVLPSTPLIVNPAPVVMSNFVVLKSNPLSELYVKNSFASLYSSSFCTPASLPIITPAVVSPNALLFVAR